MPPRPKFTQDELVGAAVDLVREQGVESLTARELGKRLGASSSPIFTMFKDMEEMKAAVRAQAKQIFDRYMAVAEDYFPSYKMRGMQWVRFAREEPNLFRLLFEQHGSSDSDFDHAVGALPFGKENDLAIIMRDYHATHEQAERLFQQMWIHPYGLCVLSAARVCVLPDEEIARILGEVFTGMIHVLQSGDAFTTIRPVLKSDADALRSQAPDLRD